MKKIVIFSVLFTTMSFIGLVSQINAFFWSDFIYDYDDSVGYPLFNGGIDINGNGSLNDEDEQYLSGGVNPNVGLGTPDESYVSILPGEYITFGFSVPFVNGPGDDLCIVETGSFANLKLTP